MNIKNCIFSAFALIFSMLVFSCSSLKELGYSPEIKAQAVALKGLDFEGISFECAYSISNPYPASFSIQGVEAAVSCAGAQEIHLSADEGITVEAKGSSKNIFAFKVPYSAILSIAQELPGKESLPFKIEGKARLDTSKIPLAGMKQMELPFSADFEVPVFKPEFSVSNPRIQIPSLTELKNAFSSSGMTLTKAASVAAQMLSGKTLSEAVLDGVDLDFAFLFDLNVSNAGSASWQCVLENCTVSSSAHELINLSLGSSGTLSASSGTVPVAARLNSLNAGKYIVQMINKKGTAPVFAVNSRLSFPQLPYAKDIPLSYSCAVPLGSFSRE